MSSLKSISSSSVKSQNNQRLDSAHSLLASSHVVTMAMEAAIEKKAYDLRGLVLREISDVADYFVVASGSSDRHVRGIADEIMRRLAEVGERPFSISGYENGEWILLDYVNIVIHVFHEPVRHFYGLDELWNRAPLLELPEQLSIEAKRLRTGLFPA